MENPASLSDRVPSEQKECDNEQINHLQEMTNDLQQLKKSLGSDHIEVLNLMENLGNLYVKNGDFVAAKDLYKECFVKRDAILGCDHIQTVVVLSALGECCSFEGDFEAAETMLEYCLEIQRKDLTIKHADTLITMYRLASLYYDLGRYGLAETLLVECYTEQCIHPDFGSKTLATLKTMLKLAYLYNIQRKLASAEEMFKTFIENSKDIISPDSPDYKAALNNLANLYVLQWKYESAELLYGELYAASKEKLGPDDISTLELQAALANVYRRIERFEDAERLFFDAHERVSALLGPTHPTTKHFLSNYETCIVDYEEWRAVNKSAKERTARMARIKKKKINSEQNSNICTIF